MKKCPRFSSLKVWPTFHSRSNFFEWNEEKKTRIKEKESDKRSKESFGKWLSSDNERVFLCYFSIDNKKHETNIYLCDDGNWA